MVSRRRRRGIPPGSASGLAPRSMIIVFASLDLRPALSQPPPSMWFAFAESWAQGADKESAIP
jgi:hypothetical protein